MTVKRITNLIWELMDQLICRLILFKYESCMFLTFMTLVETKPKKKIQLFSLILYQGSTDLLLTEEIKF